MQVYSASQPEFIIQQFEQLSIICAGADYTGGVEPWRQSLDRDTHRH